MRVLALQLKRIGDLALTTPALHALKSAGMHVTLVVTEGTAALLPLLDELVDEPLIYHARTGSNSALWKHLWRTNYDACVDFTGRDRSALLTLASRAPRRITSASLLRRGGWRRLCYNALVERPVRSRHTVDHYLDYLAPLALPEAVQSSLIAPCLRVPPEAIACAERELEAHGIHPDEDFVVVHPGTARPEKYWLPERWAQVIAFCQDELGRRCVLTGGQHDPYEQTHLTAVRAALGPRGQSCVDLAGRLTLPALAAVLARAGLVLGVDSGPMHLAAAFAPPQIVLFGPTNPFHWRPRHPSALVLRAGHGDAPLTEFFERSPGGSLDQISTRAVIDCIKRVPTVPAPAA